MSYGQHPEQPCDVAVVALLSSVGATGITASSLGELSGEGLWGLTHSDTSFFFRTNLEVEPWVSFDLGKITHLASFKVWYPSEAEYQLSDYYFLASDTPFESDRLENLLAAETVAKFHVLSPSPSGTSFSLEGFKGRYVRIQRAGLSILALRGIELPGYGEDCSNGIDDDCDGLIDCDDPDCQPFIINVQAISPSCPICPDGVIKVQASEPNLEYSLDGGQTYVPFNGFSPTSSLHLFDGLLEGDYHIKVRNTTCDGRSSVPVELRAPEGGAHGHCFNGGFEEGTFEGWELGTGTNWNGTRPPATNPTNFLFRHAIVQAPGAFDPETGFPLTPPAGGIYIARLGERADIANRAAQSLKYTFDVPSASPVLNFYYAVVLQDGNEIEPHADHEQPFFYWQILDENGDKLSCPGCEGNKVADVNDEFFLTDGFLVYKGWTCVSINLAAYIGQTLTIEFYTAGCSRGRHYGYAYIDGLCTDDLQPKMDFEINDIYCQNQAAIAETTQSLGANRYRWEVCRIYDDGRPPQCYFTPIKIGYDIPPFDVLDFFFDPVAHNAGSLNCGDRFRVKLFGYNDCASGSAQAVKEFTYACAENEISYPDIAFCGGNEDVQITGSTDCGNCTFEWTPGQYLNSSTSPTPIILGSLNTLALSQTYEVKMTNEAGCIYQDKVRIFRTREIIGAIELEVVSLNHCEQEFFAEVTLSTAIHSDELQVVFSVYGRATQGIYVGNPGLLQVYQRRSFTGELISNPGVSTIHTFKIPEQFLKRFNYEVNVRVSIGNLPDDMVVAGGNDCLLSQYFEVPAGKYHGSINVYMADAFSPNGDGNNDDYGPFFHSTESNVFAAGMRIFERWGGLIFHGTYDAPEGQTVLGTEPELRWDGNYSSGQPCPQGLYVWLIDYANCDFPFEGCLDCSIWTIDNGGCGKCSDDNYYGEVILVR